MDVFRTLFSRSISTDDCWTSIDFYVSLPLPLEEMINDTPSSRVAVCVLVACLNLITPIAIVFSATSGVRFVFDLSIMSDMGWLRNLRWFALLESIFFLVYLYRRHTMVKNDVLPPAPSAQQRVALWKDAMATIDAQGKKELEALMRGWFVRASTRPTGFIGVVRHHLEAFGLLYGGSDPDLIEMSEIKRGNVEEWLAGRWTMSEDTPLTTCQQLSSSFPSAPSSPIHYRITLSYPSSSPSRVDASSVSKPDTTRPSGRSAPLSTRSQSRTDRSSSTSPWRCSRL